MSTMNISLPETMKAFIDRQVSERGYGTSSEFIRELVRQEQDRTELRTLLLDGAKSEPDAPADGAYFAKLEQRAGKKPRKKS